MLNFCQVIDTMGTDGHVTFAHAYILVKRTWSLQYPKEKDRRRKEKERNEYRRQFSLLLFYLMFDGSMDDK